MIEVIYKDEMQKGKSGGEILNLPKNIRQIGQIRNNCRIYMEDYVYTFLGKAAGSTDDSAKKDCCLAVLTGTTGFAEGISYVFIRGALLTEEEELSQEHVEFSDRGWQKILEETDIFFEGQQIVGWFFAGRSLSLEVTEAFQKAHRKYFGAEKVLMLMDADGREEAFFRCENSFLVRQTGYYLYYERNPQMQAYMLEKFPGTAESRGGEAPDEAVHTFRKIIRKKKEKSAEDSGGQNTEQNKNTDMEEKTEGRASVFSYAAAACLVLAVASVGVRFYQNYQRMENTETRQEAVSASAGAADADSAEEKAEETILVTSAPEISVVPTSEAAPSPTAEAQSSLSDETSLSEQEEQIYREEADERKAERRIREAEAEQEETSETAADTSNGSTYVIRPGDTLYQISVQKYGTTDAVQEICELNGFSEDEIIYPGQIIVLP